MPFQLNPGLSDAGADKMQLYISKFGPQAERMLRDPNNQFSRMAAMLNQEAKKVDPANKLNFPALEFRYHEGSRVFNTLRAHMLVAHDAVEADNALQNRLMEIMFRKYFAEGKDLNQTDELVACGLEAGISKEVIEDAIIKENPALKQKTLAGIAQARGIGGVPFFRFPNKQNVSGSQPIEVFEEILTDCVEQQQ